ncbi:MAG: copper resistance CopC/CopD family protein [Gemmatimonadaceae bacterium]
MKKVLQAALLIVLLLVPSRVWAHAHLKRSDPAAGSVVTNALLVIRLWFTERPELSMTSASLKDSDGKEIPMMLAEAGTSGDNEIHFRLSVPLSPGRYVLAWRAAASDGHPSRGSIGFTVVGEATAAAPGTASTLPVVRGAEKNTPSEATGNRTEAGEQEEDAASPANSLARALFFTALLAVIGVVAFRVLVLTRPHSLSSEVCQQMARRAAAFGLLASGAVIILSFTRLYLEGEMMSSMQGMPGSNLNQIVMHTLWGHAFMIQVAAAALAVAAFALANGGKRVGWMIATSAAVALAITPALSGHAASSSRFTSLLVSADFLHVLGAASWLGTLLCVMLIGVPIALAAESGDRWGNVAALINSFSPIALGSATLVVASGILASWIHLEHLSSLWTTSYGKTLLAKLLLVACVLTIGAYNFRRVQPQLVREEGVGHLRKSAGIELAVGFLILLVTGLLTGISP